jgi:hypothetical protein
VAEVVDTGEIYDKGFVKVHKQIGRGGAFFVWTVVHSKILTLDNLGRRGLVVVNRCWLCEMEGESVDHILLHCAVARDLWNAFFARFGLCWVMPRSVKEVLASWWMAGRTRSAVV